MRINLNVFHKPAGVATGFPCVFCMVQKLYPLFPNISEMKSRTLSNFINKCVLAASPQCGNVKIGKCANVAPSAQCANVINVQVCK